MGDIVTAGAQRKQIYLGTTHDHWIGRMASAHLIQELIALKYHY